MGEVAPNPKEVGSSKTNNICVLLEVGQQNECINNWKWQQQRLLYLKSLMTWGQIVKRDKKNGLSPPFEVHLGVLTVSAAEWEVFSRSLSSLCLQSHLKFHGVRAGSRKAIAFTLTNCSPAAAWVAFDLSQYADFSLQLLQPSAGASDKSVHDGDHIRRDNRQHHICVDCQKVGLH